MYNNVTGLVANEKYLFVVFATNQYGDGDKSTPFLADMGGMYFFIFE